MSRLTRKHFLPDEERASIVRQRISNLKAGNGSYNPGGRGIAIKASEIWLRKIEDEIRHANLP